MFQHKYFADALEKYKVPCIAKRIRKFSTNLVPLPWRTLLNPADAGVYVMRHMETFFGDSQKDWECGLNAKGAKGSKNLGMLRIKYMRSMLTCAHNIRGKINQTHATRHWKERPARFNFEKWFEEYGL